MGSGRLSPAAAVKTVFGADCDHWRAESSVLGDLQGDWNEVAFNQASLSFAFGWTNLKMLLIGQLIRKVLAYLTS